MNLRKFLDKRIKKQIIAFLFLVLQLMMQYNRKKTAAAIPPLEDFTPPIKDPSTPWFFASSIAPLARFAPNPVKGTVAPQPAKSIKYLYIPSPPQNCSGLLQKLPIFLQE